VVEATFHERIESFFAGVAARTVPTVVAERDRFSERDVQS
jgi:hypothetical protein